MFSKFAITLAMAISLMTTTEAFAQVKKTTAKAAVKADEAKKLAEEAKKAAEELKKEAEKKAAEEKVVAEAKLAEAKAQAEASNTTWAKIKSVVSVSYHGEFYFVRRDITSTNEADHEIQDFKIMHNPTITIKPYKNWKFLATSEFKYTDTEPAAAPYPDRHYRSLFLLTRENLLTEAEHGFKLDAGIGRRVFDRRAVPGTYGNTRAFVTVTKKINEKLNTSLMSQYLANDPAPGSISGATWQHSLELIPTITYQITDKLSYFFNDDIVINTAWWNNSPNDIAISHEMNVGVLTYQFTDKIGSYFQFKYLHSEDLRNSAADPQPNSDSFDYYIGATYSITPKFSITPEVGSTIFKSRDGRDFFAENFKYPEFALYVDASF